MYKIMQILIDKDPMDEERVNVALVYAHHFWSREHKRRYKERNTTGVIKHRGWRGMKLNNYINVYYVDLMLCMPTEEDGERETDR